MLKADAGTLWTAWIMLERGLQGCALCLTEPCSWIHHVTTERFNARRLYQFSRIDGLGMGFRGEASKSLT